MTSRRAALAMALLCLALPAPAAFADEPTADPLINAFLASINREPPRDLVKPEDQARAVCRRAVDDNLDFDGFLAEARIRILSDMSDRQRKAYRSAAQRWLVRNCVDRTLGREQLDFAGLRTGDNGDRLLATRSSQSAHMIVWRLRGKDKLLAVDLIVDGTSTAQRLRSDTADQLRASRDNVDAMMSVLGR